MTTKDQRMSGFALAAADAPNHGNLRFSPGQSCPQQYPQALGPPLSIRAVAELLGCSAWTVRQKYLPQGLPYLRSGPTGKLVFFRDQVTQWILKRQQKGGICR